MNSLDDQIMKSGSTSSQKVLIIDDEPDLRTILKANLRAHDYEVITAPDGPKGIEQAKAEDPGLILLDMMMPGMDGNEVCRILKQDDQTRRIPIIFLTAKETMESKLEGFESGAVDYVLKPFELPELLARISSQFKIQSLYAEIENYVRQINRDLDIAKQVQKSILPHAIPSIPGAHIATRYISTDQVGGDYYDIIKVDGTRWALLVTDVSGHGVAAALITSMAKVSFKKNLPACNSLSELLETVNADLVDILQTDHFLTAFLVVFDSATGEFQYAKAGHTTQMIFRAASGKVEELNAEGLFLGCFDTVSYEEKSGRLEQGDKLVLFTDGLTECKNGHDEIFGNQRLEKAVEDSGSLDADSMVTRIMDSLDDFRGEQEREDDLTLVVMDITPESIKEDIATRFGIEGGSPMHTFKVSGRQTIKEAQLEVAGWLETRGIRESVTRPVKMSIFVALSSLFKCFEENMDGVHVFGQFTNDRFRLIYALTEAGSIIERTDILETLKVNAPVFLKTLGNVFSEPVFDRELGVIGMETGF